MNDSYISTGHAKCLRTLGRLYLCQIYRRFFRGFTPQKLVSLICTAAMKAQCGTTMQCYRKARLS